MQRILLAVHLSEREKTQHMTKMLTLTKTHTHNFIHKEIAWVEHRQLIYALNENSARINKKLSVRLENTRTVGVCNFLAQIPSNFRFFVVVFVHFPSSMFDTFFFAGNLYKISFIFLMLKSNTRKYNYS